MEFKTTFSQSFLPFGKKVVLNAKEKIAGSEQRQLIALECLNKILPAESVIHAELCNLRGRYAQEVLDLDLPSNLKPQDNELFYINADYLDATAEENADEQLKQNFEIALHCKFARSTRDQGYFFSVNESRNNLPEVFNALSLREILVLPEIEIKYLRVGICDYRYLGFLPIAPIVFSKVMLDLNPENIYLRFMQTGLSSVKEFNQDDLRHFSNCRKLFEIVKPVA